jgi:hypothetical protein
VAAGEERCAVSDDKEGEKEEDVKEGAEVMLERDLRRLSLDPKSIDEPPVKVKKQDNQGKGKGRRKARVRLSLPSGSSTAEEEERESDAEGVAPVVQPVMHPGVRRSNRQQKMPATHAPPRYFRKTHRGIGRHAFNPVHSTSDEEIMDSDAMMHSGVEDDTGI